MVVDYLRSHENFGMRIEISREDVLLDTGGGLKQAAWFFLEDSEPFILHNVDVLSTIDFRRMVDFHRQRHALATLAVHDRKTSRPLLFDEELQLCGRIRDGETELVRASGSLKQRAFSGIHVISPRLLRMLTEDGVFPIIPAYLRLASQGETIAAFRADEFYWRDLGRPADLAEAAREMESARK
jgi:NDP-sugar pyrophosphorylase family protein